MSGNNHETSGVFLLFHTIIPKVKNEQCNKCFKVSVHCMEALARMKTLRSVVRVTQNVSETGVMPIASHK